MNTTADTWTYFFAGYTVILTSLAVYPVSLFIRWKKLQDRLAKAQPTGQSRSLDVEMGKVNNPES